MVATRARHAARVGDELGVARAAFLMSDVAWLMGDPVASYEHAAEMLALANRAGSDFEARDALMFTAWCLVEGRCPRRRRSRAATSSPRCRRPEAQPS